MTLLLLGALWGLLWGSFANVLIVRLPNEKSVFFPASHCPACQTSLRPWHNVPLLSYIFLRGKCAFCHTSIPIIYPLVEFMSACLGAAVIFHEGLSVFALTTTIFFVILLSLSVIDFHFRTVPDALLFWGIALSLISSDPLKALEGATIVSGGLLLLRFSVSYIAKRESLGEGDLYLAAMMGALLGIRGACEALFWSALLALIPSLWQRYRGEYELPFIPFLSIGTAIVYFSGGIWR